MPDSATNIASLLHELVAINSINPSLVSDGPGETEIAGFVRDWCELRGLQTHWLEPVKGRPSVVAVARGTGGGRSLMLNAHLDTVGVSGMTKPFEPRTEGGRLYGRGALDMKAGLAACMVTLARASQLSLRGDVILSAVADEEQDSLGTRAVLEHFRADTAILTEPTGLELHLAHRGFAVFELETCGRASHTSQPHRGVNAITHMGRVLHEIEALNASLSQGDPHPLLGCGSAQAVLVAGGQELYTTPESCRLSYERRTLPGETLESIELELQALLTRAAQGDDDFQTNTRLVIYRDPFEVAPHEAIVRLTGEAIRARCGQEPQKVGAPWWMDAALLAGAGIPTVVFGPTGEGLHAAEEWVELASVDTCTEVLLEVVRSFCS